MKAQNYIRIALCSVLMAVCSWIFIPSPVPFSLQTFAIFFTVNMLGAKKATLSVLLYIGLGLIGLPVFTGARGGPGALLSPTGGFIIGFLLIPAACGMVSLVVKRKNASLIIGEITGLILCYITGCLWFSYFTSEMNTTAILSAFTISVLPYIIPDILKLYTALILYRKLEKRL